MHELVDGLSHLVVGHAGRLAAAEGTSVADVLQQEVLIQVEGGLLGSRAAREEVPIHDAGTHHEDTSVGDPIPELVRVRRLEPPKQAAAFLEIGEDADFLRPDTWDA